MASLPSALAVREAEHAFLGIMNSRDFQPALVAHVLRQNANDLLYRGTFWLLMDETFGAVVRPKSDKRERPGASDFDVILQSKQGTSIPESKGKWPGKTQFLFKDLEDMLRHRLPQKGKRNVYFMGEIQDKDGFVHWNVFVVSKCERGWECLRFDPCVSARSRGTYLFQSAELVFKAMKQVLCETVKDKLVKTKKRPQQVSSGVNADRFCQTWCLMFLDYLARDERELFEQLPFKEQKTALVKAWFLQTFRAAMPLESKHWMKGDLQNFPYTVTGRNSVRAL